MVMPNRYKLADMNYANMHTFTVDGSPVQMDAFDGNNWRTVLVAGLNSGGAGILRVAHHQSEFAAGPVGVL